MRLRVSDTVPLICQLPDGATNQFPQVKVYDDAGSLLATKNLTHIANGYYADTSYAFPNKPFITAEIIVYSDSGHTTENTSYSRSQATVNRIDDASQTSVNAIPTTPLLAASYTAPDNTTIGTINTKLGTPVVSIAADIAEVEAETDGIASIPTNPLLATSYVAPDNTTIGTINTKLGTPVVSIAADIAEVEAETDGIAAIPTTPLLATDLRLDNLDAKVSLAQTAATALTQLTSVLTAIGLVPTNPVLTNDTRLALLQTISDAIAALNNLSQAEAATAAATGTAAIKAKTDQMVFTGGTINANVAGATVDNAAIAAEVNQVLSTDHGSGPWGGGSGGSDVTGTIENENVIGSIQNDAVTGIVEDEEDL